jgi:hypothetical protein
MPFHDNQVWERGFEGENGLFQYDADVAFNFIAVVMQQSQFRSGCQRERNRAGNSRVKLHTMVIEAGFERLFAR